MEVLWRGEETYIDDHISNETESLYNRVEGYRLRPWREKRLKKRAPITDRTAPPGFLFWLFIQKIYL